MARWTEDERQMLVALANAKLGGKEIAERLGRTPRAVWMQLSRMNIKLDAEAANQRRTRIVRSKEVARRSGASGWTPERRAMSARVARERCQHILERLNRDPAALAARAARLKALGAAKLAWCPPEMMGRYKSLRSRVGAAEARKRVLAEVSAKEAARLAAMSPWERQLERARKVGIIERPRFAANDLTFSPTGSSLAL